MRNKRKGESLERKKRENEKTVTVAERETGERTKRKGSTREPGEAEERK